MKPQIIIALLGIMVVLFLLGSNVLNPKIKENFNTGVAAEIDRAMAADDKMTNAKALRFNNVSDGMNDFLGGYLSGNYNDPSGTFTRQELIQADQERASGLVQQTMNGVAIVGSTRTDSGSLPLGVKTSNTHVHYSDMQEKIRFCESLKGDGANVCDALDDPRYAECGVCLKDGLNSEKQRHVGGLFFSLYDKLSQDRLQKDMDPNARTLQPTIGKCSARNFVTTSARCRRRREQLLCEANGSLPRSIPGTGNGCAQCVEQGMRFIYRGAKDKEFAVVLHLIAEGNVTLSHRGRNYDSQSPGPGLRYIRFVIDSARENETARLVNNGNATQILAGQWSNVAGNRTLGFYETIVNKQNFTINGTTNGARVSRAVGANQLRNFRAGTLTIQGNMRAQSYDIQINISGFLAEPDYDEDTEQCPAGVFLGTDTSMRMLKSNPCFTNNPGDPLSQQCVASLFLAAGGTVFGRGYPTNQQKTDEVMREVSSITKKPISSVTIDDIVDTLVEKVNVANTGQTTNGQDADVETINAASMYMLGIEVRSPCDINSATGPLTVACLQYLYDNKGAGNKEGPTYRTSFGANTTFCTRRGQLSPLDSSGRTNQSAVNRLRSFGGVRRVQDFLDGVHRRANGGNSVSQQEAEQNLALCYGITIPRQAVEQTSCESNIIAEYNIAKKPITNTNMMRMSIENTQEFGPMTDVDMILQRHNGVFTLNRETITVSHRAGGFTPGVTVTIQCRQARAIQFWVRSERSQIQSNPYLMDLRAAVGDSFLWRPGDGGFWASQELYINGARQAAIPWNVILNGRWNHIAINFAQPFTGEMFLFTRFSHNEGLNCEFGPVTIYRAPISQEDITRIFNARPSWANVPNIMGYEYQGCWRDNPHRAVPWYTGNVSSREECARRARDANMNTFALQYYGECWIGSHPSQNYERYGSAGHCPDFGGAWTQQVFFNHDIRPTLNNSMATVRHSGKCVDVHGGMAANGALLIQWDCHGGGNQRFTYDRQRKTILVHHSGLCLTADSADAWARVRTRTCTGAWNQRWEVEESGHIMLSGTNMALDVIGGQGHNGVEFILYPRHEGNNQKVSIRR